MTRSGELRARFRRVLLASIGVAVVVHVAVFVLWPEMRADPADGWSAEPRAAASGVATPLQLRVAFGPPEIRDAEGRPQRVDRRLEAEHLLALPAECARGRTSGSLPARGTVSLVVRRSGRTDVQALVETSGDPCTDALITAAADALDYRWLPNDTFPAPVELVQPVTLLPPR